MKTLAEIKNLLITLKTHPKRKVSSGPQHIWARILKDNRNKQAMSTLLQ